MKQAGWGWVARLCALGGMVAALPAYAYQDGVVVLDSQHGAVGGPGATLLQTTPHTAGMQPRTPPAPGRPAAPARPATPGAPATFSNGQSTALAPVIVVRPSLRSSSDSSSGTNYLSPSTTGLRAPAR